MARLKHLTTDGKGAVAALLPDVASSTRYVEFDAPDLVKAMTTAGLAVGEQIVQNAYGSDATELADAETDVNDGATVLLVDALDPGVGAQIETYARAHGAQVIDYDRLTAGGRPSYYVSFDKVAVGKLIGEGLVRCISNWHVSSPRLVVMRGADSDDNARQYYQGYFDDVLESYFRTGRYDGVFHTAGTWDPQTALAEFEAAYSAHPGVNAALIANDETAASIIGYLHGTLHIPANTFPTTGQDATLTGLQNILAGYQCGTAYEPIYREAQAAVVLALYLRAHKAPPPGLVNGTTRDTLSGVSVPSVLLAPDWITRSNMNDTIVRDSFVPVPQLCAGSYASACSAAGIKTS